MMIKKILIISSFVVLFLLTIIDSRAFAMSVGASANSDLSVAEKQALEQKRSMTNKAEFTKTLAIYSLYLPYLSRLEQTVPFFEKCGLVTNPKTLSSFVIGVRKDYSGVQVIDTYALQYMNNAQELGMKTKILNQRKVKSYMICAATYGLIMAQTFDDLNNNIGGSVDNISVNAFYAYTEASLLAAIMHQNKRLKSSFKEIKREIKSHSCVLYGKNIKCGGVFLSLEGSPKLSWGGLDWFNPQADFAGQNDIITIGYGKNSDYSSNTTRDRAVNWVDGIKNDIASDMLTSGLL